jgi:Glycosyl hydrolase family 63 N-terminal domain
MMKISSIILIFLGVVTAKVIDLDELYLD